MKQIRRKLLHRRGVLEGHLRLAKTPARQRVLRAQIQLLNWVILQFSESPT